MFDREGGEVCVCVEIGAYVLLFFNFFFLLSLNKIVGEKCSITHT